MKTVYNHSKIIILGILLAVIYWLLEAFVDSFIFETGNWTSNIFSNNPVELWMRTLAVLIILFFSFILQFKDIREKRIKKALKDSEESYRNLVELSPDAVIVHQEGKIVYSNSAATIILGAKDPSQLLGKTIFDFVHLDFRAIAHKRVQKIIDSWTSLPLFEYTVIGLDGNSVQLEVCSSPLIYQGQAAVQLIARNITERKKIEEKIHLASKVFDSTSEAIMITNKNTLIQSVNSAFTNITGYQSSELIGQTPALLRSGKHDKEFYKSMWDILSQTGNWKGEIWDRRKNGEIFPVWLSISSVSEKNGNVINYIGVFTDITSRKQYEEFIKHQAYHDALTELPNRQLFYDRLNVALEQAKRNKELVGLIYLDLDYFKEVNDHYGHVIGDKLLQEMGRRLKECIRACDTVARVGGDEFTILLPKIIQPSDAEKVALKVLASAKSFFYIDSYKINIGVSLGISIYPHHAEDAENLIKLADLALYKVKSSGKNNFQFNSSII